MSPITRAPTETTNAATRATPPPSGLPTPAAGPSGRATPAPSTRGAGVTRVTSRRRPHPVTLLALDIRDEMRMIRREPATLVFTVLMPTAFYTLFVVMFGSQDGASGLLAGTTMLATFGTYGAVAATMSVPGVGLATSRENGWLEAVRVSPVPVWVNVAARVAATVPYVVGILMAMTAASAAIGVLDITIGDWLLLMAILVIGCLPSALVGLAVGALASPNAATAILSAVLMPMAIASGLWFPLEVLPDWLARVAPALPTYHLAQLALRPLQGGPWLGHLLALLAFTGLAGVAAAWAWRTTRT